MCCYIKVTAAQSGAWIDALLLQRLHSSNSELCTVCSSIHNPAGSYLNAKHLCRVNNKYGLLQCFMQPVYHPWLEHTWTRSLIQTPGWKVHSYRTPRLRMCSSINISIMYTGGHSFLSCFLSPLRLEAVILMWRAHHLRQKEGFYFEKKCITEYFELLPMSAF